MQIIRNRSPVGRIPVLAQSSTYAIDPAHSSVEFSIRHMAISTVHGRFSVKCGTIVLDPSNLSQSSVETVIDVTSVDTGVSQRDGHLKSRTYSIQPSSPRPYSEHLGDGAE